MALAFPLPVADFWAGLKLSAATFALPDVLSHSRTRGGEVLVADQGARLWTGSVTFAPAQNANADAVMAQIEVLQAAGASFLAHRFPQIGPRNDPDGVTLGTSDPTIYSLAANARELRLTGLPSGYVLAPGDMMAFAYGTAPVLQALHRVVTGSTADAGGLTGLIEVVPPLRPGAVTGASVSLLRPACKALLVPGSVSPGSYGPLHKRGVSFSFIQTLR